MPRTEEENQRIRDEQKKKILEGAIRVFAHKGFAATKMADVAAEANVSYGLVYHYFPNKEKVLDELLEKAMEKSAGLTQRVLAMPGTPLERLYCLISTILLHLRKSPESIMVFHQMMADGGMRHSCQEIAYRFDEFLLEIMRRLIVEGQAEGQIARDDPEQLVTALQACIRGLTFKAMSQGCGKSFPDADMLLRFLKP